jgi:hypothetical protein
MPVSWPFNAVCVPWAFLPVNQRLSVTALESHGTHTGKNAHGTLSVN